MSQVNSVENDDNRGTADSKTGWMSHCQVCGDSEISHFDFDSPLR